jgi:hypothetical protein
LYAAQVEDGLTAAAANLVPEAVPLEVEDPGMSRKLAERIHGPFLSHGEPLLFSGRIVRFTLCGGMFETVKFPIFAVFY